MWETVGIVAGVVVILLLFQVLDVAETLKLRWKGGTPPGNLEARLTQLEQRIAALEKN